MAGSMKMVCEWLLFAEMLFTAEFTIALTGLRVSGSTVEEQCGWRSNRRLPDGPSHPLLPPFLNMCKILALFYHPVIM